VELKNKEWLELVVRIADQHNDAVIILNDLNEIILSNQIAQSYFLIEDTNLTLEQVFDGKTVQVISDQIGISKSTSVKNILSDFEIILKNSFKLYTNLSIEIILLNNLKQTILIFEIQNISQLQDYPDKIRTSSLSNLPAEDIKIIKSISNEIHDLIPFTIVSLNRLHTLVEKYPIPVLVNDIDGRVLSLNSAYANQIGVESSFALGKKLEAFLPPHLNQIYTMLSELIKLNKQQIILESESKKVNNNKVSREFIQIPVLDNLNNLFAVIGLIIDVKQGNTSKLNGELRLEEVIRKIPGSIALINSTGKIIIASTEFCNLITENIQQVSDKNISDIFLKPVSDFISSFTNGSDKEASIYLNHEFTFAERTDYFIELTLKKIYDTDNTVNNILVVLNKPDNFEKSFDELQNILMYRGKMFDILIEKNPEPIFIYDKENLRFLEVNSAAIKLYGYSKDEFLQMDLTDLYAPEDIQTLLDSFGDESSEARFSKPFRHRKKDGTNVLVEISKTSFMFNDREAHFNIVKDITRDIETDKQNQMLKAIFAESEMMIFSTDASGFITFANHKASERLGYKSEELLQSSFASLVTDEDRGIVNTSIFQSYLKDTIALETKFKVFNGSYIDAEIFASPIFDFDGEIDSFTIVAKTQPVAGVTQQPKEIIKEVVKEVVKEVIVEKEVKVEPRSFVHDSNFLSGMFHEILTPINVIIGFSQELISSTENPTEEQKEAADIINQNRIKMMDTMNSVVEYSDIMQNKSPLKVETITITEIIEKLDTNIKDISGINDILFSYGKISSSLKFKSDNQKFESFILSLIKVVSRISKDKKIYFSAFPVDSETFLLGISDQYGNPSEYVSNVLEQVYVNDKAPKDYGLPKLTTYLSKTLLSLLDGKFYRSSAISVRPETGFLFPLTLNAKSNVNIFESSSKPEVIKETFVSENIETSIEESEVKDVTNEPIPAIENDLPEKNTFISDAQEPTDDFSEPQIPQIDENPAEVDDKIQTEEDYYAFFANEVVTEETNNVENVSDAEQTKSDSNVPVNISEEIKRELENDIFAEPETAVSKSVDLSKLNCLYIEDQIDSQILFKVQMKELKDVKFAASFEDAQLLLLNHQFDFIVMDINLQGEYNGLDALKIIKTMPAFSSIPIIAVTAYVLPGDKEKFIVAGFDDFISKPIFKEKMMESLEKIFLAK
jgi:PAS domain S-box-containing protein